MDKTEYQEKLDELQGYLQIKDYNAALKLVDGIDWKRVKSIRTLNMVADVYEVNRQFDKCVYVLNLALAKTSIGKSLLYRLTEVSIKQRDVKAARNYFKQYSKLAARDNTRLLLEYKLSRITKKPIEEQIKILEDYKDAEFTERWAYELASLYSKAGDVDRCVETCDDVILWFSEGKYVLKSMELKQKYKKLTPSQQAYYDKEQRDALSNTRYETTQIEEFSEYAAPRKKESVIDRMNEIGAKATKDVDITNTQMLPVGNDEVNNISVTSNEFIGGSPDLKKELEKSIESNREELESEENIISNKAFEEAVEKAATLGTEDTAKEAAAEEEKTISETDEKAEEITNNSVPWTEGETSRETSEKQEETADKKVKVEEIKKSAPQIIWDDREIPDPEPTPEERITHTIPLDKVGMNTVPISLEEAIRSETPEERRIRILNNAMPTKMNDIQRRIFTYFARIPGMDTQILRSMSRSYEYAGERTSSNGNIAIMGAIGSGKSRLSDALVVAMSKDMELDVVKSARLSGEKMNEIDPAQVVDRMSGGFLIIENAGDMTEETIEKLNKAMEFRTDCMILIIEDEKTSMRSLLSKYPDFAKKFPGIISIPVFTNDELVAFARTYCADNKCHMDELGVLALYSLISTGQSEDHPMTISEVKEILDIAISKAKRGGRRGRRGINKNKSIILYEKDFA